jgi:hypothetical protein
MAGLGTAEVISLRLGLGGVRLSLRALRVLAPSQRKSLANGALPHAPTDVLRRQNRLAPSEKFPKEPTHPKLVKAEAVLKRQLDDLLGYWDVIEDHCNPTLLIRVAFTEPGHSTRGSDGWRRKSNS